MTRVWRYMRTPIMLESTLFCLAVKVLRHHHYQSRLPVSFVMVPRSQVPSLMADGLVELYHDFQNPYQWSPAQSLESEFGVIDEHVLTHHRGRNVHVVQ